MRAIKEKKERALGVKLFLKADRCSSPKCVMIRRPYRPGVHGQRRSQVTEFGRQLKEKQKIQIVYGLNNRQLQNLFRGNTPSEIFSILETRLDRAVFHLGLAKSQRIARQMVSHGHILLNGRKVTIPSICVRVNDVIEIRPNSLHGVFVEDLRARLKQYKPPAWLKIDAETLKGTCIARPDFGDQQLPFDLSLVGQYYSR